MDKTEVDILIIGGGIVGSLLSLMLTPSYQVLLCDASDFLEKTTPDFDVRSLALNEASMQILQALGLGLSLKKAATAIETIQVSSQGQFGTTTLKAEGDKALGYVIEMHEFYSTLAEKLNMKQTWLKTRLTHYDPFTQTATLIRDGHTLYVKAKIVVAADGTGSSLRPFVPLKAQSIAYPHQAVVANIELKRAHRNLAIERFTSEGPLALLPFEKNKMSLVWCVSPSRSQVLIESSELDFLKALQAAVGYRVGRLIRVGKRETYPLTQLFMPEVVSDAVVFVGNAAQTLHPVAGQGLNLGLRDIATLAQYLVKEGLSSETLSHYQSAREKDRQGLKQATHSLVNVFTQDFSPIRFLRSLGLVACDQSKRLKSTLIRHASGYGSLPPDLACGIPLDVKNVKRSHSEI